MARNEIVSVGCKISAEFGTPRSAGLQVNRSFFWEFPITALDFSNG